MVSSSFVDLEFSGSLLNKGDHLGELGNNRDNRGWVTFNWFYRCDKCSHKEMFQYLSG